MPMPESRARWATAVLWSALAIALGLVAFAWRRLLRATGPGRRALLPILGPALLVGASEATYAITLLRTPLEDPDRTGFAAIFLARSVSYTLLALGLAWSLVRVRAHARAWLASPLTWERRRGPECCATRSRRPSATPASRFCIRGAARASSSTPTAAPPNRLAPDRAVARIARGDRPSRSFFTIRHS